MRSYEEYVADIRESGSVQEQAGFDLDATQQLAQDVFDFRRLDGSRGVDPSEWDSVRDILSDRLAHAYTNFNPTYLDEMSRVSELGEGELMTRLKNNYSLQMRIGDTLDDLVSFADSMAEKVGLEQMSEDEWEKLQQERYEASVLEDMDEDMQSYKKSEYLRILESEGFSPDVRYDDLPAYVTERLYDAGIENDGFMHRDDAPVQRTGRIYGDGRRAGVSGLSLDDDGPDNGLDF